MTSNMKVFIYTHAFAPKVGGVETYVMLLAQGIAKNFNEPIDDWVSKDKVEVTVATLTPADGFDDALLPFRVIRKPGLRTLWRCIREADIIQLAGPAFIPLLFSLLQRKPVVVEHHGYQVICPNGLLFYEPSKTVCPGHFMARWYSKCLRCNAVTVGWFRSFVMLLFTFPRRWMCRRVAANVPISYHVLQRIQLPRSQVIYYGVPDPFMAHDTPHLPPNIHHPITFAYVGRLVSEKGLSLLLEAVKRLKNEGRIFRVLFIGDGPERNQLEAMTDAFGLQDRVQFTGFLRGQTLEEAMNSVTAIVMPSIWEETAGLAAIEHMMRGRVVIVANIGGLGEVVGEAGLKFLPGDVAALTECLRRILLDSEFIAELGRKSRERALRSFHLSNMIKRHIQLYHHILKGRKG